MSKHVGKGTTGQVFFIPFGLRKEDPLVENESREIKAAISFDRGRPLAVGRGYESHQLGWLCIFPVVRERSVDGICDLPFPLADHIRITPTARTVRQPSDAHGSDPDPTPT